MAGLSINQIGLSLDQSEILKAVSVTVPHGKVLALLGPSGSGKTALMRAVAGLARPHTGSIRVGGEVVFDAPGRIDVAAHKRRIGLMFQTDALSPKWTVFENVAFCAKRGKVDDIRQRTDKALTWAGIPDLAERHPQDLPLFEQRMVALARALVCEPQVLLLDEPLSTLEGELRAQSRAWLRQVLPALDVGVLTATRNPIEALAIGDRIAVLNNGAIEQEGTPTDIYQEPATVFAAEITAPSNRLEGRLVENSGPNAVIEILGSRIAGVTQTRASLGSKATGMIRVERTQIGGGPGQNRIPMKLTAQMYLGERWEFVFVKESLTVRAYGSTPLRHDSYHIEFPADATWIF
jgi:iron(III) transport system ATP-binding protein